MVQPQEDFILVVERSADKDQIIHSVLSIGYESHCLGVYVVEENGYHKLVTHRNTVEQSGYIILDVRSEYAYLNNPQFTNSINIPIEQLRNRLDELDENAVYVPYCGGLYKSSIAVSVLQSHGYTVKKMYV
jgi:rhodanese-related sulfurtransferase